VNLHVGWDRQDRCCWGIRDRARLIPTRATVPAVSK
jgi:hypothetical protein